MHILIKEESADVSHELLSFLKNWFTKHIMRVDQKYTSLLSNGEIEQ
jgi:hemerythrin